MGLKLLHSADWHLDAPFGGFTEQQRKLLRAEQRKIPGKIADLCRREGCDLVLLAGDIFDGKATRETMDVLKTALREMKVPVLIAPGNHDFCQPGSPWLTEKWPDNVLVFTGGMEMVPIPALDCRIYGAGFQSMDSPSLMERFQICGEETYQIGVFHGDPVQKNSPCNPVTAHQVRHSGLNYLALGHIHKAGAFRAGSTICAWPGCPMGRGWDETGEKGVCIVTLGEQMDIRAVSLDTLRFCQLDVDIDGDAERALEAALPAGETMDFYRVNLTGSGSVNPAALKRSFARVPNLELRDMTEAPVDPWESAGEDSLEGIYFQMLQRKLKKEPENEKDIQLAAEISRKLLLGKEVTL